MSIVCWREVFSSTQCVKTSICFGIFVHVSKLFPGFSIVNSSTVIAIEMKHFTVLVLFFLLSKQSRSCSYILILYQVYVDWRFYKLVYLFTYKLYNFLSGYFQFMVGPLQFYFILSQNKFSYPSSSIIIVGSYSFYDYYFVFKIMS